jgi:uncharacterized membrane protein YfcA
VTSDPYSILIIFVALAMGGTIKGATGGGAPVIAVPVMAAFFDVRIAVMLMAAPNLVTNIWQCRAYWADVLDRKFALRFALAGAAGTIAGTLLLATMPIQVLTVLVALAVIAYVGLRVIQPDFRIEHSRAARLAGPIGILGGVLQGAGGISAPFSISFLNAMRMERRAFIGTVSVYFIAMAATQLPALFATGLMTPGLLAVSGLALIPLVLFMPVGAWAAQWLSPKGFDRLTLVLLSLLAMRLLYTALG